MAILLYNQISVYCAAFLAALAFILHFTFSILHFVRQHAQSQFIF